MAKEDTAWYWGQATDFTRKTRAEFDSLLSLHIKWLYDSIDGLQLNLTMANLEGICLVGAELMEVNLRGANLCNAHLEGANLTIARLEWAMLKKAHLQGAHLIQTHLDSAFLMGAHLEGSDLRGAYLVGADLNDAHLNGAVFQPSSLPNVTNISNANGLKSLRFDNNPSMLVALREEFAKNGFKQQERDIICALRRNNANILENIFFDFTSEYGSNLYRPWYILIGLWLFCGLAYYASMVIKTDSGVDLLAPSFQDDLTHPKSLIKSIENPRSIKKADASFAKTKIYRSNPFFQNFATARMQRIPVWIRLWWWAFFFSTMSAFNIGFRDINFGRFLRLLPRKEFDLKPFGWIRSVSGFQALCSVYLIGLWVLSFAGTPFK